MSARGVHFSPFFLVIQYVAHIHNTVSGVKKLTIIDRVAETTFDPAVIIFITGTLFIGRTAELFGTFEKKNLIGFATNIYSPMHISRGKKNALFIILAPAQFRNIPSGILDPSSCVKQRAFSLINVKARCDMVAKGL